MDINDDKNKKTIIRKIPLKAFMNMLHDIYSSGADYIDLHGLKNEESKQDEVTIAVPLEYMMEEKNDPQILETPQVDVPLNEDSSINMSMEDIKAVLKDV